MKKLFTPEEFKQAKGSAFLDLECLSCGQVFSKKKTQIKSDEQRNKHQGGRRGSFCSPTCATNAQKKEKLKHNCKTCGKEFRRKASDIRSENVFCSHSCAATFNNTGNRKHGKDKYNNCPPCGAKKRQSSKQCKSCHIKSKATLTRTTKGELFKDKSWANARSSIQTHARKVLENSDKPKQCKACNYDLHVDCCHIRDVSDFPDSALINEINALDNLVWLCKNHHWEFDHGYLGGDRFL